MNRPSQSNDAWAEEQRRFRAAARLRTNRPKHTGGSLELPCPECGVIRRNEETLHAHRVLAHKVTF